jgi:Raf kinase inhibitor-like YbhB/YbcL family protein
MEATMPISITSDFPPGGNIPIVHTCDGANTSPPLAWLGTPKGAHALVLIMDDPDAPDPQAPKQTWVHWVLYNIPAHTTALPVGVRPEDLPPGTKTGLNDWKEHKYSGPCPPIGRHRYFFKLYAVDKVLPDMGHATKAEVEAAMQNHVLDHGELVGTYQRKK